MANKELREKALALRLKEQSYSQIKEALGVSKSTLHYWLKDFPLSKERIDQLRGFSERRIERYRATRRKKREEYIRHVAAAVEQQIFPFSKRDLFIAGYMLYWGEGLKAGAAEVSLANTDPGVICAFVAWMEECFNVERSKMSLRLHLYSDMDIEEEFEFWEKVTRIPRKNFAKPHIKESLRSAITYKGMHGHGTCNIRIFDVELRHRVIEGIKLLRSNFMRA